MVTGGAIGSINAAPYGSTRDEPVTKAVNPASPSQMEKDRTNLPADTTESDNTGRNKNDRPEDRTAGNQSNSKPDMTVTREIRKALMNKPSLSTAAHNIKIITADGLITLRGPVLNEAERTEIMDVARKHAGDNIIQDQLEIKGRQAPVPHVKAK